MLSEYRDWSPYHIKNRFCNKQCHHQLGEGRKVTESPSAVWNLFRVSCTTGSRHRGVGGVIYQVNGETALSMVAAENVGCDCQQQQHQQNCINKRFEGIRLGIWIGLLL